MGRHWVSSRRINLFFTAQKKREEEQTHWIAKIWNINPSTSNVFVVECKQHIENQVHGPFKMFSVGRESKNAPKSRITIDDCWNKMSLSSPTHISNSLSASHFQRGSKLRPFFPIPSSHHPSYTRLPLSSRPLHDAPREKQGSREKWNQEKIEFQP